MSEFLLPGPSALMSNVSATQPKCLAVSRAREESDPNCWGWQNYRTSAIKSQDPINLIFRHLLIQDIEMYAE